MSRLANTALAGGERKDATDHCLAGIARLDAEVKDVSSTLPPYDVRTYSEVQYVNLSENETELTIQAVKALQDKLAETQAAFAPKQKFTFKTRKNASAMSLVDAAEMAASKQCNLPGVSSPSNTSTRGSSASTPMRMMTPPNDGPVIHLVPPPPPTRDQNIDFGEQPSADVSSSSEIPATTAISSQISSHIIVPPSARHAHSPCQLSNLQACCIDLSVPTAESAAFASLTVNGVESSLLLCSSISGPAHITNVKNSVLVLDCKQFRMHECENVDIYLYCTSRPIIEDCKNIRFAEIPPTIIDLLHSSLETAPSANLWDQIDDFKWLKAEQSPNWSILPRKDQISELTWTDIVPGKVGSSVSEILTAVGIRN